MEGKSLCTQFALLCFCCQGGHLWQKASTVTRYQAECLVFWLYSSFPIVSMFPPRLSLSMLWNLAGIEACLFSDFLAFPGPQSLKNIENPRIQPLRIPWIILDRHRGTGPSLIHFGIYSLLGSWVCGRICWTGCVFCSVPWTQMAGWSWSLINGRMKYGDIWRHIRLTAHIMVIRCHQDSL